jgi:phenolic acid decarboxylase
MKLVLVLLTVFILSLISFCSSAQTVKDETLPEKGKKFFIDVHYLKTGKTSFKDVADAHMKDLAVEKKYGVEFLRYWVDEQRGVVYCLSSAADSESIVSTHREAHGLLPATVFEVTSGGQQPLKGNDDFYLDIHELGPGNVTAKEVAHAHKLDLGVQAKHGVNFINYWVDERKGVIICLSQAKDSTSIVRTHEEAHGLLPEKIYKVQQGQ